MKETIAIWAICFSVASFALYLVSAIAQTIAQMNEIRDSSAAESSAPNVTGFFSATKDLVEALSKASPSVVALIASLAYLSLAGMATGVFGGG